jgi:menaquinone-dependent protoporphyrinogen oxidase
MKSVLVAVASRHGSTAMFSDCIREELEALGLKVHVLDPELLTDIAPYDAVVLGSAVYGGRWLKPARRFAERFQAELAGKPVWLFSSGPVGDPPKPAQPSQDALELAGRLGAREHRVFAGRIVRDTLGLGERIAVRVSGAAQGDFRPWPEIAAWARSIADALLAPRVPAPAPVTNEAFGTPS